MDHRVLQLFQKMNLLDLQNRRRMDAHEKRWLLFVRVEDLLSAEKVDVD